MTFYKLGKSQAFKITLFMHFIQMMLFNIGCFILVLSFASLAESQVDKNIDGVQCGNKMHSATGLVKIDNIDRRKMAISRSTRGIADVQRLLTVAKKIKTKSKNYRNYEKEGNYYTALADFNSLKPKVTKTPNWSLYGRNPSSLAQQYLIGDVGDVRLVLWRYGDRFNRGPPVLEIRSASDALYDRIVYKSPKY